MSSATPRPGASGAEEGRDGELVDHHRPGAGGGSGPRPGDRGDPGGRSDLRLEPDLISTGTPAGVGAVGHGDEIVAEVTGVGRLGVTVDATGAVPCPTSGAGAGPVPPPVPTPVRGR